MSGGFSFGDLKKGKKGKIIELDSGSTITTVPTKDPPPRGISKDIYHAPAEPPTDWKKKFEDLEEFMNISNKDFAKALEAHKKAYTELQSAFALSNENNSKLQLELGELNRWADMVKKEETQMHELKDEIHMLRVQESMQKKALDILTIQAEKFKFRPHQYSEIARLLICMRVRGNKSQKEQVLKIVGSTAIEAVRDHIFELLEAPYQ